MRHILMMAALLFTSLTTNAEEPQNQYIRITTDKGECVIRLYNQTPKHRDNFIKLVNEGYFNGLLFHRVIEHFMIQGGDPDSRNAVFGQQLGEGGPDYTIDAEFNDSLFHKKGVLAAARDDNPAKASSASQFYLVQGKAFTDATLDSLEQFRLGGHKIPAWKREIYKTLGGVPHLDQNYTVFGEIVKGLSLIDSIAAVRTDSYDRPVSDIRMQIAVLNQRERRILERELAGLPPRNTIFDRIGDFLRGEL